VIPVDPDYVYHGTDTSRLDSIRAQGLVPNEYGSPINFHDDPEVSFGYYGGGDSNALLLRVHRDRLKDYSYDRRAGHTWTSTTVPPSDLEVYRDRQWSRLV
jgi:RNA:NAD 2'-phosphotransferase (TPT1/KptA family)